MNYSKVNLDNVIASSAINSTTRSVTAQANCKEELSTEQELENIRIALNASYVELSTVSKESFKRPEILSRYLKLHDKYRRKKKQLKSENVIKNNEKIKIAQENKRLKEIKSKDFSLLLLEEVKQLITDEQWQIAKTEVSRKMEKTA